MTDKKTLNRRSFFARVAGGAVLGGAAMSLISGGQASATDRDPSDPAGVTDRDSNDRPGQGRGSRPAYTDHDSGDRPGQGRGPRSDQDPNDPRGHGRGSP